jgi:hypothetical protein
VVLLALLTGLLATLLLLTRLLSAALLLATLLAGLVTLLLLTRLLVGILVLLAHYVSSKVVWLFDSERTSELSGHHSNAL